MMIFDHTTKQTKLEQIENCLLQKNLLDVVVQNSFFPYGKYGPERCASSIQYYIYTQQNVYQLPPEDNVIHP